MHPACEWHHPMACVSVLNYKDEHQCLPFTVFKTAAMRLAGPGFCHHPFLFHGGLHFQTELKVNPFPLTLF